MPSGLPNCLLPFQSIVSPCTFWVAVLNKNSQSAIMRMCIHVIYPYLNKFYLHKSWDYCLMSLESEHYLLEDCLCLLKHVDLNQQSEVQAKLVKIVLCWMSVIHPQNMKHDKLRGKISKTPLNWKPHLRRDVSAPALNICYTEVRQRYISDTHAGFSPFNEAEVFIVWPFPSISVEHHTSPEPWGKHLGVQLQPRLHGLFLQHRGRLARWLRSGQLLTAVVVLTSITEREIRYCHHQGLVYA